MENENNFEIPPQIEDKKNNNKIYLLVGLVLILIIGGVYGYVQYSDNYTEDKNNETQEESYDDLSQNETEDAEYQFQHDADIARLEHLVYWTGLIEEYYDKNGQYPLEGRFNGENFVFVQVVNSEQYQYFDKNSENYIETFGVAVNVDEVVVKEFVKELEDGLGRGIDEYYDIQLAPSRDLIGYRYFVDDSGYLFYVTCIEMCGDRIAYGAYDSEIATLFVGDDYVTPTVNIGAGESFLEILKVFERGELLNNDLFKDAITSEYFKEDFVREREQEYINDSKGGKEIKESVVENTKTDPTDTGNVLETVDSQLDTQQIAGVSIVKYVDKYREAMGIMRQEDADLFVNYAVSSLDELLDKGLITQGYYDEFVNEITSVPKDEMISMLEMANAFGVTDIDESLPADKFVAINETYNITQEEGLVIIEVISKDSDSGSSGLTAEFFVDAENDKVFFAPQ